MVIRTRSSEHRENVASRRNSECAGNDSLRLLLSGRSESNASGVSPRASEEELMTAYRELTKVYHPDRLASMQLPAEMLDYAEAMQRRINAAFDELRGAAKTPRPQPAPERPVTKPPAQPQQPSAPQPTQPRQATQPDMSFKKDCGPRWVTERA